MSGGIPFLSGEGNGSFGKTVLIYTNIERYFQRADRRLRRKGGYREK